MDNIVASLCLLLAGAVIYFIFSPVFLYKEVKRLRKSVKELQETISLLKEMLSSSPSKPAPQPKKAEEKEKEKEKELSSPISLPPPEKAALPLPQVPEKEEKKAPLIPLPEPSPFEKRTREAVQKIWNWFIVGEEYRKEGVKSEYAIAATWLLRGGFLLLLFGVGYFIKFSHERNLFPPELRLAAAGIFAMAAVAAGCRMMGGKYKKIGLTLAGGGFAALYATVFAAFSLYKLLPGVWTLGLLVFLTLCGLCLALGKNSMILALLAVAGGYLAPVLTSSGSRNLTGLFLYMGILGAGVLATAFFRSWRILHIMAFLFSWGLFLLARPFKGDYSFLYAWIAGSGFFLLFSLQILLQAWRGKEKTALPELLVHFANTLLYGGIFLPLLIDKKEYGFMAAGGVTLFLSLYYLFSLALCLRKKERDEGLSLTLLLEGAGLLALTIPLLLGKNVWGFAWSLQALLMFFGGRRLRSRAMENLAYILLGIAGVKLLSMDLFHTGGNTATFLSTFWERCINFLSLPGALAGVFFLMRKFPCQKEPCEGEKKDQAIPSLIPELVLYGAYFFFFIFFWKELSHLSWNGEKYSHNFHFGALLSGIFLFIPLLLASRGVGDPARVKKVQFFLFFPAVIYLFAVIISYSLYLKEPCFPWHLISFVAAFGLLGWCGKHFQEEKERLKAMFFPVAAGVLFFLYTSIECYQMMNLFQNRGAGNIALSILWMIYGFVLVWGGVKKEMKALRFTGLGLFFAAFIKIFLLDLAGSPPIYRIGGCLLSSAFLTAGAFLYIKFQSGSKNMEKEDKE